MRARKFTLTWVALAVAAGLAVFFAAPTIVQRVQFSQISGEVKTARTALPGLEKGDTLSPLFRAVSQIARPAVVVIEVTERVRQPTTDSGMRDFLRHFFGNGAPELSAPQTQTIYGLGSGIIVDANNGYILTNWHVVHGAETVEVILADGRHFKTQWVRTDHLTDLAVVKIDASDLISIPLGDSDNTHVGDWVLAVGAPEGLPHTVTAGIISAKGRTISDGSESFFQTDASINPGNSGGPLVSTKGEVIGVNTAIVSPSHVNAGIGLTIPSNTAKRVMTQLIEKGKVIRGYIGVEVQNVNEKLAKSFNLPSTKGALVAEVVPDGPAAKAGVKAEDFITAISGKLIDDSTALRRIVTGLSPGEKVPFEVYRKGQKLTVTVEIEQLPQKPPTPSPAPPSTATGRFGISVTTLTPDLAQKYGYGSSVHGALITAVQPGSEAAFAGVAPGMVILQIDNETVTSSEQAEQMLSSPQAASGVRLLVTDPSGAKIYMFLQAG